MNFDEEVTITMTRIEAMSLRAGVAEMTTEQDAEAVRERYGDEAAKVVEELDAGYEAFVKLGEALGGGII